LLIRFLGAHLAVCVTTADAVAVKTVEVQESAMVLVPVIDSYSVDV
jgi:hypothetical protein